MSPEKDAGVELASQSVDLSALTREADLGEIFAELDADLIGLEPVKRRIKEISSLLIVDRARALVGLQSTPPSLHMCFTGNSGVGKTTVARRMAKILHRLGYIRRDHVVSVTRDDLVGQFIGHTAPKTKEALKRAMGGVLFIDEAYYLYRPENERDYGQESIEILLQVMEDNREDLVVILAGYTEQMRVFFTSNPGMASRIAHNIDFPDYTAEELFKIAQLLVANMHYRFDEAGEAAMRKYIELRQSRPNFANARSIRNALDRARLRQARRLCDGWSGVVDRQALETIVAADILASRVFSDDNHDH